MRANDIRIVPQVMAVIHEAVAVTEITDHNSHEVSI